MHCHIWCSALVVMAVVVCDSYLVQQEDQLINTFRLLDRDNRVVLSINSPMRIIVTAADVLHS